MMNIASTVFPDAPAIPAESMPTQNSDEEGQPFGALLASLTDEVPTTPPLVVEPALVEESVELPVAEIGEENAADEEDSNPEPDAAAMVLSSCLAMWQILPPAALLPPPATEIGAILGMPVATVKSTLHRALAVLRGKIERASKGIMP